MREGWESKRRAAALAAYEELLPDPPRGLPRNLHPTIVTTRMFTAADTAVPVIPAKRLDQAFARIAELEAQVKRLRQYRGAE